MKIIGEKSLIAIEQLIRFKESQMESYIQENQKVLGKILELRKELTDLQTKATNIRINRVDEILKK